MRLLTFIRDGEARLGALIGPRSGIFDEEVVDLAAAQQAHTGAPPRRSSMRDLIEAGPDVWARLGSDLESGDYSAFARPLSTLKLTAPVAPSC